MGWIFVLIVLIAVVALIIFTLIRDKKAGRSSCAREGSGSGCGQGGRSPRKCQTPMGGIPEMTLDEINEEIRKARQERKERFAKEGRI